MMALYRFWIGVVVSTCLLAPAVYGEIYKWVDKSGKVHFSDTKPTGGAVEQVEVKVNTITSPSVSESDFLDALGRRKVVMYSAVWCGVCKKARRYFQQEGIPFKEYDIESSRKGRQDFAKLNGRGVPIILVGKQQMSGFSADRFKRMYAEARR
ncbi:MAG: DUF4124 domain-containing protein [Porticoccus sp.]